jgi:hypothetical protein
VVFGAVVRTFDGGGGNSPKRQRLPHLLPQADGAVAGLLYVAPEPAVSLAAQRWESPASRRSPEGVKPHPEAAADALLAKHGDRVLQLPSLVAVLLAPEEDTLRQLEQQGALSDEAITSLFAKLEDGLRNHVLNGQRKALRAYESMLNKAGPALLARIVLDCRDMPGLPWIKR